MMIGLDKFVEHCKKSNELIEQFSNELKDHEAFIDGDLFTEECLGFISLEKAWELMEYAGKAIRLGNHVWTYGVHGLHYVEG